jgi:hypothetical protein
LFQVDKQSRVKLASLYNAPFTEGNFTVARNIFKTRVAFYSLFLSPIFPPLFFLFYLSSSFSRFCTGRVWGTVKWPKWVALPKNTSRTQQGAVIKVGGRLSRSAPLLLWLPRSRERDGHFAFFSNSKIRVFKLSMKINFNKKFVYPTFKRLEVSTLYFKIWSWLKFYYFSSQVSY